MKLEDIQYDVPIEVTKEQYRAILKNNDLRPCVAHRVSKGKSYIKLWIMKAKPLLYQYIK